MTDKKDTPLKPCPFCGGDDVRFNSVERPDFWTATISCWTCDFGLVRRKQSKGYAETCAKSAWNNRANTVNDELVDALEDARTALVMTRLIDKSSVSADALEVVEKALAKARGEA